MSDCHVLSEHSLILSLTTGGVHVKGRIRKHIGISTVRTVEEQAFQSRDDGDAYLGP